MPDNINQPNDYILQLYITGASPNSAKAISNIKKICDRYLTNGYKLDIIDIYQQPAIARKEEIVALPLLIRTSPLPVKRLVGNMSDTQKVLKGLELQDLNAV
jgi:circadian clock protein KaiB